MTESLIIKLKKRELHGNLRQPQVIQNLIDLSSNDYLGLARSIELAHAVVQELDFNKTSLNGLGSTGSRLLTGNTHYAIDLEEKIAEFHGFETGVLFNCGYMANVGLLSAVADSESIIFFDAQIHASSRDGIRLSQAKAYPFRHNDSNHLEHRLQKCLSKKERFICIESIYSTDGSVAPLEEICQLAIKYGAYLIVDEAHAIGVMGNLGSGLVSQKKLNSFVFAQVVTFGKALGVHGAIVLGSQLLKKSLINFSTAYIYTTALSMHSLTAIKCSYDLFPTMENARRKIKKLIKIYKNTFLCASETHIQGYPLNGNQQAKVLAHELNEKGIDARPLLSPTVQRGKEVLRICLHAFNTEIELDALLALINPTRN